MPVTQTTPEFVANRSIVNARTAIDIASFNASISLNIAACKNIQRAILPVEVESLRIARGVPIRDKRRVGSFAFHFQNTANSLLTALRAHLCATALFLRMVILMRLIESRCVRMINCAPQPMMNSLRAGGHRRRPRASSGRVCQNSVSHFVEREAVCPKNIARERSS